MMKSYPLKTPRNGAVQKDGPPDPTLASPPLADFEKYLAEHKLVQPPHVRYYVRWADRFLRHCGGAAMVTKDEIPTFTGTLRRTPRIEDWQVRQAENAAKLYLQMISPIQAEPGSEAARTDEDRHDEPAPDTWEHAVEMMQRRFRILHYSVNTERTYIPWVWKFQEFVGKENPNEATPQDAKHFLTHLALHDRVSASYQNQAFNALLFFFRFVIRRNIAGLADTVRARRRKPLPVVLSRDEIRCLFKMMGGTSGLMARLVYASGIRSRECVGLRVQDLDFSQRQLIVRAGKGDKDRSTLLPRSLHEPLRTHLERVRKLHLQDLSHGYGEVCLPDALSRKYPNAGKEWIWQYVFPAATLGADERTNTIRRFHASRSTLRKAIQTAACHARIPKRVGTHTLRHSFATHLLEDGVNIRIIQDLLGHRNIETTMIYTHVMRRNINGVTSPLESMTPEEEKPAEGDPDGIAR